MKTIRPTKNGKNVLPHGLKLFNCVVLWGGKKEKHMKC